VATEEKFLFTILGLTMIYSLLVFSVRNNIRRERISYLHRKREWQTNEYGSFIATLWFYINVLFIYLFGPWLVWDDFWSTLGPDGQLDAGVIYAVPLVILCALGGFCGLVLGLITGWDITHTAIIGALIPGALWSAFCSLIVILEILEMISKTRD
jgi:hypothetical protein